MTKTPFRTSSTIGSINSDHCNLPNFSCATDMHFISPGTPIDFGPYEDSLGFSFRFQNLNFYTNISEFNFEMIILKLSFIHVSESRCRSSLSAVNKAFYPLLRIMYNQEGPTTDSTTVHILNAYISLKKISLSSKKISLSSNKFKLKFLFQTIVKLFLNTVLSL